LAFGILFAFPPVPVQASQISGLASGTSYYLRNINSGLYLEVQDASTASGANVQIYPFNPPYANAQKWQFIYLSNGYYVLRSELNRNNALSVENNFTSDGSNVIVKNIGSSNDPNNVPNASQWMVDFNYVVVDNIVTWDGTYRLSPKSSNLTKLLDPRGAGPANSRNVVQYKPNGGATATAPGHHQKWGVEKAEASYKLNAWHLVGKNIVTGEKHLDWSGSTKYQTQFNNAVSVWNAHRSGVIRKQSGLNITDVKISDNTTSTTTDYAVTSPKGLLTAGKITFFTKSMDKFPLTEMKQYVATHELGHALGLDEYTGFSHPVSDVMRQGAFSHTSLSYNDRYGYDQAYKNY